LARRTDGVSDPDRGPVGAFRVLAWSYVTTLLTGGWYTIQGVVELGSVEEHEIRFISYYVATIHYSYSVNNAYYSGHFEKVFLHESSADRFVANRKGQAVFIRSHPHRPDRSALVKQDQRGGWPA
jgi:hypothetical protein